MPNLNGKQKEKEKPSRSLRYIPIEAAFVIFNNKEEIFQRNSHNL